MEQQTFKVRVPYEPYFYIAVREPHFAEVDAYLRYLCVTHHHHVQRLTLIRRKHAAVISSITAVMKEDLELRNHLSGLQRKYMKLSFHSVQGLLHVRADLQPTIERNRARMAASSTYDDPSLNMYDLSQ